MRVNVLRKSQLGRCTRGQIRAYEFSIEKLFLHDQGVRGLPGRGACRWSTIPPDHLFRTTLETPCQPGYGFSESIPGLSTGSTLVVCDGECPQLTVEDFRTSDVVASLRCR